MSLQTIKRLLLGSKRCFEWARRWPRSKRAWLCSGEHTSLALRATTHTKCDPAALLSEIQSTSTKCIIWYESCSFRVQPLESNINKQIHEYCVQDNYPWKSCMWIIQPDCSWHNNYVVRLLVSMMTKHRSSVRDAKRTPHLRVHDTSITTIIEWRKGKNNF